MNGLTRRTLMALTAASCVAPPQVAAQPGRMITGVNLAGLEFGRGNIPGRLHHKYETPTAEELDFFRARGANAVRIPFLWERAQPELEGPLDEDYVGLVDALVEGAAARGMWIVLDPHQYGRRRHDRRPVIIGESEVTSRHFAHFWRALAGRYRNAAHAIFGLQNEPHDQRTDVLIQVQNEAIAAIRGAGARQLILASGNGWSGAHSWLSRGNEAMLALHDAQANMAFEVHQYLDQDSSGTHAECTPGAGARLESFTAWARANRRKGFLGEFGAGPGPVCLRELEALLRHMRDNRDVWIGWTAWAGGPWWDDDYPLALEPRPLQTGQAPPQLAVLERYFE